MKHFLIMILSSFLLLNRRMALFRSPYITRGMHLSYPRAINYFSHKDIIEPAVAAPDAALDAHMQQLKSLRGTPELVDRLESLCSKYPGIELNMNLYRMLYSFNLDAFQEDGLTSLISGKNVVVMTPTGSGKTLVGELAIYFALMMGLRVAYTTPLKALSNQKFQDFKNKFGADRVGLLTGDISINRGAQVTVMTTEVFRNMVYDSASRAQLSNLFMVCFDEFHFMNDPERGTVWEESVISCPSNIRMLALSATMGNVEDITAWITSIHGPTALVRSELRPVPLRYFFGMKQGLFPLFKDPNAGPGGLSGVNRTKHNKLELGSTLNPTVVKKDEQIMNKLNQSIKSNQGELKGSRSSLSTILPRYDRLVEDLFQLEKLPAIVFIFSRVGCDDAAKMLMKLRTKLLTAEEVNYVNLALTSFIKANPEIPVSKQMIRMLQNGIGVHHAGLISVWKAFIEDLFNANKIKVLFATETLAAGVNMPARTTVITTVTKRINSELLKLRPSQLLQMAGRAGRRGKDVEGSVVILKNKFDDVDLAHRILTSPVDGIKSHFRASYALTVKLLTSRSLVECKTLIERGFGAYLLQKKMSKKDKKLEGGEKHRLVLQEYTLKSAREFYKLHNKLDKEQRALDFLTNKIFASEAELVQTVADYMPLGTGLVLRNGESSFFLGEVKINSSSSDQQLESKAQLSEIATRKQSKPKSVRGYAIITKEGKIRIVRKEHIHFFATNDSCLSPQLAQQLLDLVHLSSDWESSHIHRNTTAVMTSDLNATTIHSVNNSTLVDAYHSFLKDADLISFAAEPMPYSITKQQIVINEIRSNYDKHPIVQSGRADDIIDALSFVTQLKDPMAFVDQGNNTVKNATTAEVFAWKKFLNVVTVLEQFGALENTQNATSLGHMISSFSADNELWLSTLLSQTDILDKLSAIEFGALISSLNVEPRKVSNAMFRSKTSKAISKALVGLEPFFCDVRSAQEAAGLDFPVLMSGEICGLAETWCNGCSWRELCSSTSLDQGDICRIFRRTVEVLRQIPQASYVHPSIVAKAMVAADAMDRFPIADYMEESDIVTAAGTTITDGAMLQGAVKEEDAEDIRELLDSLADEGEEEREEQGLEEEEGGLDELGADSLSAGKDQKKVKKSSKGKDADDVEALLDELIKQTSIYADKQRAAKDNDNSNHSIDGSAKPKWQWQRSQEAKNIDGSAKPKWQWQRSQEAKNIDGAAKPKWQWQRSQEAKNIDGTAKPKWHRSQEAKNIDSAAKPK